MTALTASFTENGPNLDPTSKREPSIKRKRLHLLYLVNDILYHTKYRVNDASICGKVQPILVNLLGSAASFAGCPKHHGKIQDLLKVWEERDYYSRDYIEKLREAVKNASEAGRYDEGRSTPAQNGDQDTMKAAKSAPYVMPAMHGDASTPWFDLPAGNLMPHIVPNSTRPINPDMIKPLQFIAGPADEGLVMAVKGLLDDVQKIFGEESDQDDKVSWDIDELGQPIILDEITGDVLEGEGYYGWSRTFCEKMKRRRRGLDRPDRDGGRGRTSRSQSRSSTPDRKRRRYSRSDDESSPDDYRRSRARRRYSSSRSRSPDVKRPSTGHSRSQSRNRSYSRSPPRSSSPRKPEAYSRDARPSSAPRPEGLPPKPPMPFNPPVQFQGGYNAQFPPPPPPFPPPPSINFNGWQPPPPPLHNHPNNFNPSNPSQNWPPPPLPPPNPHFQQHPGGFPPSGPGGWQQQQQMHPSNGRGYNNNGWAPTGPQGRGGRGNYRGKGW